MRIIYFRMKGYINILQGTGKDELIIPFDKLNHRIILITGPNGSGKSTLLRALTPTPDGSDSFRTDVIVDPVTNIRQVVEYPGEKEIHYAVKNDIGTEDIYKILIQSVVDETRTRRTTRAYISKNGVELNPNGTVSGFKDIRDSLLDIDPTYLDMSMVSSENRGLVDMTPSERKRYLSYYIGSLETFNQINKTLSKKTSTYKNLLTDLNSRIAVIGNEEELRVTLLSRTKELSRLNSLRDELLKEIAQSEATISLLDPDNKKRDLYDSIYETIENVNSILEKLHHERGVLISKLNPDDKSEDFEDALDNIKGNIEQYTKSSTDYKAKLSAEITKSEYIEESINQNTLTLNSMTSDSFKDNIEDIVNNLKEDRELYISTIDPDRIDKLNMISIERLNIIKSKLDSIKDRLLHIFDNFQISDIRGNVIDTFSNIDDIDKEIHDLEESKYTIEKAIITIQQRITDAKKNKDRIDLLNNRPEGCTFDDCVFIKDIIQLNTSYNNDVDLYIEQQEILLSTAQDTISSYNKSIEEKNIIREFRKYLKDIISAYDGIFDSDFSISELNDIMHNPEILADKLEYHMNFQEFDIIDIFIYERSVLDKVKSIDDQLRSLETDLEYYNVNKKVINSLQFSIESSKTDMEECTKNIIKFRNEIDFIDRILATYKEQEELLTRIINIDKEVSMNILLKKSQKEKYDQIKEDIKMVSDKTDLLNGLRQKLQDTEDAIRPISEDISKLNFDIANLAAYKEDYARYSSTFEKLKFLKDASSPGSGNSIQSEYIKIFMNDIMISCNEALRYIYNEISMLLPIIDDKQFSIPFIGMNQIVVPDISMGSTSQKCMFGLAFACASMMRSSSKYNIMRFDEIDGGLDQEHRSRFIDALNLTLDTMRSEQCIMISHNTEFDDSNVDRIVLGKIGELW